MRIPNGLLPPPLYCWIFEHDDIFKHDTEPEAQHRWCQRCYTWLPPEDEPVPAP